MANDPDTGIREGDQVGQHGNDGVDQKNYTHTDTGSSGASKTTHGGAGTAGSVKQSTPGAATQPD